MLSSARALRALAIAATVAVAAGETVDAASCADWAKNGECIRNPAYMWATCKAACAALTYLDTDASCAGWAESGECEKNAAFMIDHCNKSCVDHVQKQRLTPQQARPNPHRATPTRAGGAAGGSSRAATFVPIFLGVALVLGVGVYAAYAFAPELELKQEQLADALTRAAARLQRRYPKLGPRITALGVQGVARILICCYFLNEGLTVVQTNPRIAMLLEALFDSDGAWTHHDGFVDFANLAGAVAAALCVADVQTLWCAGVMMGDTLVDCYQLLVRIMWQWAYGRGLYINELMAKKFSLLGCVGVLIAITLRDRNRGSTFGLLLERAPEVTTRLSLALLLARMLIAVLFLYVGCSELNRLIFQPFTPYLPGDGHDVVWPKAVQLLLSVPFTLGFRTTAVARLLALSLVLEAFYAWAWWRLEGPHRRAIHSREHFATNIATAGGLLLLQKMGAGKYTVDELMKKKD